MFQVVSSNPSTKYTLVCLADMQSSVFEKIKKKAKKAGDDPGRNPQLWIVQDEENTLSPFLCLGF